jgi:hypothetical protein
MTRGKAEGVGVRALRSRGRGSVSGFGGPNCTALSRFTGLWLVSSALLAGCGGRFSEDSGRRGGGDGDSSSGDGDGDLLGDGDGELLGDGDDEGLIPLGPESLEFTKPEFDLDGDPKYSRVIPQTNRQWSRSVQTVLNLAEPPEHSERFLDPVRGVTLFDNNENVLLVGTDMAIDYQLAAAEIALQELAEADALSRIDAGTSAEEFIRTLGRRAYRRPLTEAEVEAYLVLYAVGTEQPGDGSEFVKGANLVIEALLQSPHFLYRSELSPDGGPLTGFERASKLSFWILGTSPDDALLDRAAAGEFDTETGVAGLAEEMLADPRASEMITDLYGQLFKVSYAESILKEDPLWSSAVNRELVIIAELFFQHIYESDFGLDEILTSTDGFVGPLSAPFYGIEPAPDEPTLMDLGPERPGYFSQLPFQMTMSSGLNSDAIHRGHPLVVSVMCAKLRIPENVEVPPLPEVDPNSTSRQRLEAFTGADTCGESCHGYIDPLGFAFENFDGLGRVRTTDNGQPVDTSGSYPFGEGENPMVSFDGAPELMSIMAGTPEAHACLAKSLMSYALARDITSADESLMSRLAEVSMSENGSIKQVLREIAKSPAFLSRPGAM